MLIDHEYRLITPTLARILADGSTQQNEPVLWKQLGTYNPSANSTVVSRTEYLQQAIDVSGLFYRGVPLNTKAAYLSQEAELPDEFLITASSCKRLLSGYHVVQLPNPDLVSPTEFERMVTRLANVSAFELIPSWHGRYADYEGYYPYLAFVQESELPLCLEVDYFFRRSKDEIAGFFELGKRWPLIRYWLPHFGCGVFLYWDALTSIVAHPPLLLSSVPNSMGWFELFETIYSDIPIAFATDHPFNGGASLQLYSQWSGMKKWRT